MFCYLRVAVLVEAARYLQAQGLTVEQLRSMHHSRRRLETFASTYRYFGKNKELKHVNIFYAERLIHVAERHRATGAAFEKLISQALARWPLRAAA